MNRLKIFLLSVMCACLYVTTYADEKNCQAQISLQLQEEGWVTSKAAQVTVGIQVATSKNDISSLMDNITDKLKKLVKPSAVWRLVDLSTQKNSAGLFAVSAQMTARLDNDQLAQLQSQIESLNKAGEQYKIDNIDYQPTLSEIAAENTRLRGLIYQDILEQEKLINTAFSGSAYQLYSLSFDSPYVATPKAMMMYTATSGTRQTTTNDAMPFSQQIIVTANIIFSTPNFLCDRVKK